MANIIISSVAGVGALFGSSSSNTKSIFMRYTPATPIPYVGGSTLKLSQIFPQDLTMSINFDRSTGGNGTIPLLASIPLFYLAHVAPLNANAETFCRIIVVPGETDQPDTLAIESVEFQFPLFSMCRRFQSNDSIKVTIENFNTLDSIEVWSCSEPAAFDMAAPIQYSALYCDQNTSRAFPSCTTLYIPTAKAFRLNITGKGVNANSLIMDLQDFDSNFSLEPIANITPYQCANFVGLSVSDLNTANCTIQPLEEPITLFYTNLI